MFGPDDGFFLNQLQRARMSQATPHVSSFCKATLAIDEAKRAHSEQHGNMKQSAKRAQEEMFELMKFHNITCIEVPGDPPTYVKRSFMPTKAPLWGEIETALVDLDVEKVMRSKNTKTRAIACAKLARQNVVALVHERAAPKEKVSVSKAPKRTASEETRGKIVFSDQVPTLAPSVQDAMQKYTQTFETLSQTRRDLAAVVRPHRESVRETEPEVFETLSQSFGDEGTSITTRQQNAVRSYRLKNVVSKSKAKLPGIGAVQKMILEAAEKTISGLASDDVLSDAAGQQLFRERLVANVSQAYNTAHVESKIRQKVVLKPDA